MRTIRRADEIFATDGGWFHARWHFSFGHYRDPRHMGVGALRVFNDDAIVAGAEWPMHHHRDIESLTYVVDGSFSHADSLGNGGELGPGGAQVMTFSSAGAEHSERNGSNDDPMRFIQFWILPSDEGLDNGVQQRQFDADERTDTWLSIMSPVGEPGLDLSQDAHALVSRLTDGATLTHDLASGRGGYLYVIDGDVDLQGPDGRDEHLTTGDALSIAGPQQVSLTGRGVSELIMVDVPLQFEPVGIWRGFG